MIEKKADPIKIGKGELVGIGRDKSGNKVAKFKTNIGKSFSIQTNGNLPILHKVAAISDIDKKDLAGIKKEVLAYIKDYGTKMQKAMLESTMKIIGEANTKTGICPTCGSKYLLATNYCVKCKKKVKKETAKKDDKKKESIVIDIQEEIQIGDVMLETGDKIEIMQELTANITPIWQGLKILSRYGESAYTKADGKLYVSGGLSLSSDDPDVKKLYRLGWVLNAKQTAWNFNVGRG